MSVKSLYLTLAVFLSRYIDLVHISGDTYLLCMRLLYWAIGIGFVLWVTDVEPWQSSVDHARDTAFPRLWTVMAPLFVVSVALFYTAEPFASDKFGLYNPLNEVRIPSGICLCPNSAIRYLRSISMVVFRDLPMFAIYIM